MSRPNGASRLLRACLAAVCTIAALQVFLGLMGLVASAAGVGWEHGSGLPDWQRAANVLAFGGLAAHLLLGARRDPRVEHLGALLLVVAVFFALPPIRALDAILSGFPAHASRWLQSFPVHAFTPALAWLFFRDFPRALDSPRTARIVRGAIVTSLAVALLLIAANVVIGLGGQAGGGLALFDRTRETSHYWTLVFGLLLPTFPFAIWQTRTAPQDERRRVGFFVSGLALAAIVPVLYAVLPPLSPRIGAFFLRPPVEAVLRPLNLAMNLSFAGITAYAVLVQHVLDVRTVLRKAAQYALARGVVAALAGIPFALLALRIYRGRDEPLARLFEGAQPLPWLASLLAALLALRLRQPVRDAIDRLFFREEHDARRILAEVTERSRSAESSTELAHSLTAELDRALHLESIGLLVDAPEHGAYLPVSGSVRRLDAASALALRLAKEGKPLLVDPSKHQSDLLQLRDEDWVWIADAGAEVLVPLVGSQAAMTAILALGPKRSELPFSHEDLLLLSALGGAAGIGFENLRLRESGSARAALLGDEQPARECARCGTVVAPGAACCTTCGGPVHGCPLPQELFGKFHLDRRIGSGGMGVVYRATDLTLGRAVALKTLPATSPTDAARLRREARAMAAITHPNLALIFGAEAWQGTPILVIEYLAGHTLGERLARGALEPAEALELGATLADALGCVHDAGILHRDVKPSNIGFTETGIAKLLDFGLVRIAGGSDGNAATPAAFQSELTESGLLGTPLYMSPEALAGERPDASFDLWSLAVVTFEAIAGAHPFERRNASETLLAIQRADARKLGELRPDCPDEVARLFERALAPERAERPSTARELALLLRSTAAEIAVVAAPTALGVDSHGPAA